MPSIQEAGTTASSLPAPSQTHDFQLLVGDNSLLIPSLGSLGGRDDFHCIEIYLSPMTSEDKVVLHSHENTLLVMSEVKSWRQSQT